MPFNNKVYCSELIWDAYKKGANLNLDENASNYPLVPITPDEVNLSKHTNDIAGFIFEKVDLTSMLPLLLFDDEPTPPTLPTDGLVVHYKFDGNMNDSSGNGYNVDGGGLNYSTGIDNQAGDFDGVDDWISLNAISNANNFNDKFSVSVYFKTQASPANVFGNIIFSMHSSIGDNIFRIGTATAGEIFVSPKGSAHLLSGSGYNDDKFHHLVVTLNDGVVEIYIDNIKINTINDNNFELSDSARMSIGQDYDGSTTTDFFNGLIDELRVYNRALTETEVSILYNQYQ